LVSNRSEVLCLDLNGKSKGKDDPAKDPIAGPAREAQVLWRFDMRQHLGINPHEANNCAPLVHGRFLYVTTGNGVDATHVRGSAPDVPSLIVLDKKTGQLLACDDAHIGPHLSHGQWSSPALGKVNGQNLVFFGGGDGVCYAFRTLDEAQLQRKEKPVKLEQVWSHNGDPRGRRGQILIVSSPVFHDGKVYVAAGGDGHVRQGPSWLHCIDATKTGDISQSGTVWSYEFRAACVSTPSIHDGRLYLGDFQGTLHCVDLQSGKALWTHAHRGSIWGAALVADGKVYVGTRSGEFVILADSATKKVISQMQFEPGRQVMQGFQTNGIHTSPVAANRVFYLATNSQLFALQKEASR
jgi:outer membrane protein assembly factor BamB